MSMPPVLRGVIVVYVVVLAAASTVVASRADAAVWKPRQRITHETQLTDYSVAIDRRGDAAVAWSVHRGDSGDPVAGLVRVSAQGASHRWGKPVTLATRRHAVADVEIATDRAGTATAVWSWSDHSGVQIAVHRRGHRWSKARWLGRVVEQFRFAEAQSGAAAVGYSACPVGRCRLRMRVRSPRGVWTRPTLVAGGGEVSLSGVAVNNRGDAVVTWSTQQPLAGHSATRPAEGHWAAAETDVFDPTDLVLDQHGVATMLYTRHPVPTDPRLELVTARLKVGPDAKWGTPQRLARNVFGAVLALDPAGSLTAAWWVPDPKGALIQSAVRPAHRAWSQPVTVAAVPVLDSWSDGVLLAGRGKAVTLMYRAGAYGFDLGDYTWLERRNGTWAVGQPVPVAIGLTPFVGAANRRGELVLLIRDGSGLASINGTL